MKFMATLFLILVVCLIAEAQTFRIDVGGNVSASYNLGYKNPNAGVYVNSVVKFDRFALEGDFSYLARAQKTGPGDGYAFNSSATVRVYVREAGGFYFFGGGRWIQQYTSKFDANVFRPLAGAGYDFSRTRNVKARYDFKDKTDLHRASVLSGEYEQLLPFSHTYLAFRPQVQIVRFEQDREFRYGVRAGVQIGVGFAK